ncbi:MAG TPA: DUF3857 domain-containing protein [Chitinophagaceae bacterium]|nr:DUF3857 domain-containing protein [Chitinophagaceae bacterium]
MKILLLIVLLGSLLPGSYAADPVYAFDRIPVQLLLHANAVKRYEEIRFEVVSLEKARSFRKVAYTILNEKGDKFAHCLEHYDKLQSVESIEGTLFDENGKKIKSLRNGDIQDRSGNNGSNLADDNRLKSHNFYHKIYPYTVEYIIELRFNHTMYYPGWVAVEDENISVESGKASVVLPAGMDFRYKAFNFKNEPVITNEKSQKVYSWEVHHVAAIEAEYAAPYWYEISPVVCMAPIEFSIQGYRGTMANWSDFGKFVYALNAGRDQLPDNIRKQVHELTDQINDPRRKVAVLYDFLQQNSHYISIQLGLGGWQPFDARYVAANRYGDCKALSNYMFSLLKECGLKSFYTLVKAGEGKTFFIADFPSFQFNHVILSVPMGKDTIWLECTNQTLPPGYLSGFTSNRNALLIDESGGILVRTPDYSMNDNLQVRKIKAELTPEGGLGIEAVTTYKARQEDRLHSVIHGYTQEKVSEFLKADIDLPNYDVVSFSYKEEPSALPFITEKLSLTAKDYAQVTGKRLFVCANILSKSHRRLGKDSTRKYDIELGYPYMDIDSVEIAIPKGYIPEAMPKDLRFESRFGVYSASTKVLDDKIIYLRKMEQYSGRFPSAQYNEMVDFYDKIIKADYTKVVLKEE